jgi:hypothetical protein
MIVYCSIEIVVDCLKVVGGAIGLELGCSSYCCIRVVL